MIRRPPRSTQSRSSAASDVYKRQMHYYTEAARRVEDYSGVKQLGVDETSKAKGHDYVSLFVDLEKRRTIFVAEGKGSETMTAFTGDFKEHHGNPADITDVSIDM